MKQSKFSELYQTLSNKEKTEFWEFSSLSMFKLSEMDNVAIQMLKKAPRQLTVTLDDFLIQSLFQQSSKAHTKAFGYVKNHLLSVLLRFLKWKLTEVSVENDLELLKRHHQKKAEKNFETQHHFISKSLEHKKHHYNDFFYVYKWNEVLLEQRENRHRENIELIKANESLDLFFVINKLRLYCKILNEQNILNREVNENILQLFAFLEQSSEKYNHPLIILYRSIIDLLQNQEDERLYHTTFELIKSYEPIIEREINVELCTYLKNRCTHYFNSGNETFVGYFMTLIKYLKDKKLLINDGVISHPTFKNAITAGLVSEDFVWVEHFMKEYLPFIVDEEKAIITLYHQANLNYYQGDLEKALDILANIEKTGLNFKDHFYRISYSKLFIKIYIEQRFKIGVFSRLNTFAKYIYSKRKISQKGKLSALEFVAIVKKILQQKPIEIKDYEGKLTVADYWWLKKLIKFKFKF